MDNFLSLAVARLKEPSTWVGLGSLVTAVGFAVSPDLWQAISAVGMGVGGLVAVILKEKSGT